MDEVATVIRSDTESVVTVRTAVDEISHGSSEQARGIDQISRALFWLEQTTRLSAAGAQESASAGRELKTQTASMEHILLSRSSDTEAISDYARCRRECWIGSSPLQSLNSG